MVFLDPYLIKVNKKSKSKSKMTSYFLLYIRNVILTSYFLIYECIFLLKWEILQYIE